MLNLDLLRNHQRQRLDPALESWNLAKASLQEAITLAETREREFRELSEDVRRRLDALALVETMAEEFQQASGERALDAAPTPSLPPPSEPALEIAVPAVTLPVPVAEATVPEPVERPRGRSWRPLFTAGQRSRLASLSITR